MNEELLSFVWQHRLCRNDSFKTQQGDEFEIIHPGYKNNDAGPDFFNAKIKIAGMLWAGNVEIHTKNSDWIAHGHHQNSAYSNVILHVVGSYDKPILHNNRELPTFVLSVPDFVQDNYQKLQESKKQIACSHLIDDIALIKFQLYRLCAERMEKRAAHIHKILEETQNDWNEAFYRIITRYFGMKNNALPFEMLAKSLPLSILAKHKDSLLPIEALFLGQAGFLDTPEDEYTQQLQTEYLFLQKKYNLQPIQSGLFQFARLRPVNFPTVRIAQLAALIHQSIGLFSKILEADKIAPIKELFACSPSDYWETHYRLGVESKKRSKRLGEMAIHAIIINSVVPTLFGYGKSTNDPELQERAIQFLEDIPPENNTIISQWADEGITCSNAYETQGLLELYNEYCLPRKCLYCQLGGKIVKEPTEKYQVKGEE